MVFNTFKTNEVDVKLEVEDQIEECAEKKHSQQVAYSVHKKALTQICFSCGIVTTNYKDEDD